MTEPRRHAVAADHLFDGTTLAHDLAVVVEGRRIAAVVPRGELPAGIDTCHLPSGLWLAPGFVDVQVNGGGDVLFNDSPTPEGIAAIAAAHRKFGTTALLPTLISDTTEKMQEALHAITAAIAANPAVIGIHFEGPLLSPDKPGIHDGAMIRPPAQGDVELFTGLGNGVTLVTLAPECVPPGFIARLAAAGVRVSLGHSMATYERTRSALVEGLTGFTHLFNAMRPLTARDPGPVAAALECAEAWIGLIVDGLHVAPAMLRLALRGAARPMLVSDAMPPVGGARAAFRLQGHDVAVRDGRCLRADGTLAGAILDMGGAVRNCVRLVGMPLTAALRAASAEPAEFLGLGHELGRLAPGARADMVALDPGEVRAVETWVAGQSGAALV